MIFGRSAITACAWIFFFLAQMFSFKRTISSDFFLWFPHLCVNYLEQIFTSLGLFVSLEFASSLPKTPGNSLHVMMEHRDEFWQWKETCAWKSLSQIFFFKWTISREFFLCFSHPIFAASLVESPGNFCPLGSKNAPNIRGPGVHIWRGKRLEKCTPGGQETPPISLAIFWAHAPRIAWRFSTDFEGPPSHFPGLNFGIAYSIWGNIGTRFP